MEATCGTFSSAGIRRPTQAARSDSAADQDQAVHPLILPVLTCHTQSEWGTCWRQVLQRRERPERTRATKTESPGSSPTLAKDGCGPVSSAPGFTHHGVPRMREKRSQTRWVPLANRAPKRDFTMPSCNWSGLPSYQPLIGWWLPGLISPTPLCTGRNRRTSVSELGAWRAGLPATDHSNACPL